jgi:hypothetical protein
LPQASCFFIAGVSAAMKKKRGSLRDLCGSAVRMLFEEVAQAEARLTSFTQQIVPVLNEFLPK